MGALRCRGWYGNVAPLLCPFAELAVAFDDRLSLRLMFDEDPALLPGPIGMTSMASSMLSSSSTVRDSGRGGFDSDPEEPEEEGGEGDRERGRVDDTGSDRSVISSNIS